MAAETPSGERPGDTPAHPLVILGGFAFVLLDVVLIYGLVEPSVPPVVGLVVAGVVAIAIGGSFLAVVAREYGVSGSPSPTEKSAFVRTTEVIVAITVVLPLAVFAGNLGWLVLRLSAAVGGPDPTIDDGDPLRRRLLDWSGRNRAFVRENGRGDLPLSP
jgi:dolichol kinase